MIFRANCLKIILIYQHDFVMELATPASTISHPLPSHFFPDPLAGGEVAVSDVSGTLDMYLTFHSPTLLNQPLQGHYNVRDC